jgi:hypothetical protein
MDAHIIARWNEFAKTSKSLARVGSLQKIHTGLLACKERFLQS